MEAGNSLPAGTVGTSYGDAGVTGAALIAAGSRTCGALMGLEWIVVRQELPQESGSQSNPPSFCCRPVHPSTRLPLGARRGWSASPILRADAPSLEVRWGHAPGREAAGEASAAEKVAASAAVRRSRMVGSINCLRRPSLTCAPLRTSVSSGSVAVFSRRLVAPSEQYAAEHLKTDN